MWADLQDFQSIQISGLMWEDHLPDFVLKTLNKCLPSQEQEEAVLNVPEMPRAATLDVHTADWLPMNHVTAPANKESES